MRCPTVFPAHATLASILLLSLGAPTAARSEVTLNVHVSEATYSGCDDPIFDLIAQSPCHSLGSDPVPGPAMVWVVVSLPDGDPAEVSGIQFGVEHDGSVLQWTSCTGGFEIPEDGWPASGTGTAVTWDGCSTPPFGSAPVGFFQVEDGSAGSIALTVDPRTGSATLGDCDGENVDICDGNLASIMLADGATPICEGQPGTLPASPTGVSAAAGSCPVTVSWSHDGSAASGFEVRRDGIPIGTTATAGRSFVDHDALEREQTYVYTVVARNGCGEVESGPAPFTPPGLAPVLTCETESSCGEVLVTWDDPHGGETGFRILRDGAHLATVGPDVTSHVDATGTFNTAYLYAIEAFDTCGGAPVSESAEGIRLDLPRAAADLTASTDRCAEVLLTWTDLAITELSYEVWRDGAPLATLPPGTTSYPDADVASGVSHTYVVVTTNPCGTTDSAPVEGSRTGAPPPAVSGLTATSGWCELVRLAWVDESPDEDGFRVLRNGIPIATLDPDAVGFDDDDPPLDVPATYDVVAFNACGDQATDAPVVGLATAEPPPSVSDLSASISECGQITLTWSLDSPDATGIRVLRNGQVLSIIDPDRTTLVDDFAPPEVFHEYVLVTIGPCGETPSDPVLGRSATDDELPGPEIVAPEETPECESVPLAVRWRSNPLAVLYEVDVTSVCGGAPVITVSTSDTTWVFESLPAGELHFQVRALNGCDVWGPPSACRTTMVGGHLDAPDFVLGLAHSATDYQFAWPPVESASSYVLRVNGALECYTAHDFEPTNLLTFEVTGNDTIIDLSEILVGTGATGIAAWVFGTVCESRGDSTDCWVGGATVSVPAPVEDVYAIPVVEGIEIGWRMFDRSSVTAFEIHRRVTGRGNFYPIRTDIPADEEAYRVVDADVVEGVLYTYRLLGRNGDGSAAYWTDVAATAGVAPARTRIAAVTPNPFNPRATISIDLSRGGPATLDVYDGSGRRVRRLVDGTLPAGRHRVTWDGLDDGGRGAASGTYYARLDTGHGTSVMRMVLVR